MDKSYRQPVNFGKEVGSSRNMALSNAGGAID